MRLTLITPWVAALVGIFSTGFAIAAYPSLDQYSQQNHYRVPHYELEASENQSTILNDSSTIDAIIGKQAVEKWPNRYTFNPDKATSLADDKSGIIEDLRYAKDLSRDKRYKWLFGYVSKIGDTKTVPGKIKPIWRNWFDTKYAFVDYPHKRSNISSKNDTGSEENEEQTDSVMTLEELVKYWGIDILDEEPTTARSQRGDIEITDLVPPRPGGSATRGDISASLVGDVSATPERREKRDLAATGRKLLWSREAPNEENWGFAEDDGLLVNDQTSEESNERDEYDEREHIKGNRHYGRYRQPPNDARQMREKIRLQEEERQRWEEQERRRDEERRRIIEDEQRRKDEEQQRKDEEQRRRIEDEQRRIDEEQRRNDEEQRRNDEEQEKKAEEQRRNEELRRRNNADRQRSNERNESNRRNGDRQPSQKNENDSHEARTRQRPRIHDSASSRAQREKEQNTNQANSGKSLEDLENERKLQDYIRRNTPIAVGNPRDHNRGQPPARLTVVPRQRRPEDSSNEPDERRRPANTPDKHSEYRKRIEEQRKHHNPPQDSQLEEQTRRRQEEYRRRQPEKAELLVVPFEAARTRNRDDERRNGYSRHNNQPTSQPERVAAEDEQVGEAERQQRLREEQRRRYQEQQARRAGQAGAQGVRGMSPTENQRYGFLQDKTGRTMHDTQGRASEQSNPRRPASANEATAQPPGNRYRQPQTNAQENSVSQVRTNDPVDTINRSQWRDEEPEVVTPSEAENRRISIESRRQEEDRRRQEEERQRQEEERQRQEEERQRQKQERQRQEEERQRQEEERLREEQAARAAEVDKTLARLQSRPDQRSNIGRQGWPPSRQAVPNKNQGQKQREDETTARYLEFKENNNSRSQYRTEEERKREEERLRHLPVSATIEISRPPSNVSNDSDDEDNVESEKPVSIEDRFSIEFPGISPSKAGIEVQHFQQGPPSRRRPPVESPKACVWSIVICCSPSNVNNKNRLRQCFEGTNCPEATWDTARCSPEKVKTANKAIMNFYLMGA